MLQPKIGKHVFSGWKVCLFGLESISYRVGKDIFPKRVGQVLLFRTKPIEQKNQSDRSLSDWFQR